MAPTKGVTPSQLALAWVLAQGDDVVPIPGPSDAPTWRRTWPPTTSDSTAEELDRIDEVLPVGAAAGDRYGDMTPVHR